MILSTDEILSILKSNNPISIVRAGDGEKLLLESDKSIPDYQLCIQSVIKRQLGFEPVMSEVYEMRLNLIRSYESADIIGLPAQKNLQDLNRHWQQVSQVVKPLAKTNKFCSTDIGYDLLYSSGFDKWLYGKKNLVYIGCRDLDAQIRRKFNIRNVHSYIIPPEAKFTTGYEGQPHYPYHFNKMEWWLDAAPCERSPCLVGAGVIGKIYTNWMRDRGGIAFDIGAVMDLWAGRSTRGATRGLDAIDETYKL